MNMQNRALQVALSLVSSVLISACASGAKKMAQLEGAIGSPTQLDELCQAGTSAACAMRGKPTAAVHPLSIMQGVSSAQQSRLVIVAPKQEKLSYFVRSSAGLVRLPSERFERSWSPLAVDQVEAFNLKLNENYELLVISSRGELWDRRTFQALDLNKKEARFVFISCMDDTLKEQQALMWDQLLSEKPDLIFMIGDNVYADKIPGGWSAADEVQLWNRYVENRSTLNLFKSTQLIPVFATWDDHDYGRNDSDRTYQHKAVAARNFYTFFPQSKPSAGLTRGPGVSSWLTAYGVEFALLDDRSFRSPNRADAPDQTHFGAEQEDWIVTQLKVATKPVFMISGDQFFGGYHPFESYQGSHPKSFAVQTKRWQQAPVPLVFVSGDRHLTEIIRVPHQALGYASYELTSSALHTKAHPNAFIENPSPQQLVGKAGINNYMLVQVQKSTPKSLRMTVRSMGPDKTTLFEKALTVKK